MLAQVTNHIFPTRPRWLNCTKLYAHTTVYPKKYAHGFVVLCFVVVMQSYMMNSHEVFIHIHQGCFAGTGAIVRLPQCQWSKPDGYGKISQCITTTKHSKAKTVCIFLGIYCMCHRHCVDTIWQVWYHSEQGLIWRQDDTMRLLLLINTRRRHSFWAEQSKYEHNGCISAND